jgi:hypothetical protein
MPPNGRPKGRQWMTGAMFNHTPAGLGDHRSCAMANDLRVYAHLARANAAA